MMTMHRDFNVDIQKIGKILKDINKVSKIKVVLPIHPRTKKELKNLI